ncbi:MAG: HNH endonuclease [Bacteroidota bacterium]
MDSGIRLQIFKFLEQQVAIHDHVLPFNILTNGFYFKGQRVPLLGPSGIWKPAILDTYPISITSNPEGPYDDVISDDSTLQYRYRGKDPNHRDNVGLKLAMQDQVPLIFFQRIVKGKYLVHWPVYIVAANDLSLTFTVEADRANSISYEASERLIIDHNETRRKYVTYEMKRRLHQQAFREKVLHAYHEHCALCRLKHRELLDAAHIIPDSQGGKPIIPNGMALCKIHHAAFDMNIIGISPDYIVKIREDILHEIDGPMLKYGLQSFNDQKIFAPKGNNRPDPDFLAQRFEEFKKAI